MTAAWLTVRTANFRTGFLLCLLLAACAPPEREAPGRTLEVRVLSFNVRYGTAPDEANAWPHRAPLVQEVIRGANGDFVGLQEALRFQIDAIRTALPGYGEVGVGREDGREEGEYSAILYRSDRWAVTTSGTFWLSDTPQVAGSKGWGNEITRIVTWARFVEAKTGKALWLYNTHFDHVSQPSRLKSARLLASRIAQRMPPDPVIVTGDLNAGEDNPAILYLKNADGRSPLELVDSFRVLHPDADAVGTFNAFDGRSDGPKIDYVFVEPDARVREAGIIHDRRNARYASDHYPVYAEVILPVQRTGILATGAL
jgi:endonuclease/exonuclease/phosphatase family metal-dependent hydrolase